MVFELPAEHDLMSSSSLDEIRHRYGEWTGMSIHLGGGLYTLPPKPDGRLRRILQITCDLAGKPPSELRVLDLACLEGHYGIELAMQGAEVVGIEFREANLAKARFVKDYLHLDHLTFYQDDVRNLSVEKYGQFDLVICAGILYHLTTPDVFHFVRRIHEVCTRLTIFDTHIALEPIATVEFENEIYHGLWYKEHDEAADPETQLKFLWSSVGNVRSFWFTQPSLANIMARIGFSTFYECLNPYHTTLTKDRRVYIAIKGQAASIHSSPQTATMGFAPVPEQMPVSDAHLMSQQVNFKRGPIYRLAQRLLPHLRRTK